MSDSSTASGQRRPVAAPHPQRHRHQPLLGKSKKVTMNKPRSTATASSALTAEALMKGSARIEPKDALYKVGTGIHRAVFNASKGRIFGKAFGMPIVELVTIGRRSG